MKQRCGKARRYFKRPIAAFRTCIKHQPSGHTPRARARHHAAETLFCFGFTTPSARERTPQLAHFTGLFGGETAM